MECKGINGTVEFDGAVVTIKRIGAMARMTVGKGEKRIPIGNVMAVRWKPPSRLIRGFIAFTVAGGIENRSGFGKATVDAAKDENAVVVGHTQESEFLELRDAIETAITAQNGPIASGGRAIPEAGHEDPAEQLRKLNEFHLAELLTDEEFAGKRSAIVEKL
jgi:hypothetical protein